jgi:hypothetical protein
MSKIFAAAGAILLLIATFWEGKEIIALPGIFFCIVSLGISIENIDTVTKENNKMLKKIQETLGIEEEKK